MVIRLKNKGFIKQIPNKQRYIIMTVESEYYLLDRDRSWFRYIFPAFDWLIPQKAIKISIEDIEALASDATWNTKIYILFAVLLGLVFLFERFELNLPSYLGEVIILFVLASIGYYRIHVSKQSREKVEKFINFKANVSVKIVVRPKFIEMTKAVLGHFFIGILNVGGVYAFFTNNPSWILFMSPIAFIFYLFIDFAYLSRKEHHVIFKDSDTIIKK